MRRLQGYNETNPLFDIWTFLEQMTTKCAVETLLTTSERAEDVKDCSSNTPPKGLSNTI
jgi:hypothetical protein